MLYNFYFIYIVQSFKATLYKKFFIQINKSCILKIGKFDNNKKSAEIIIHIGFNK
jgi:hypothetical protein